MQEEAAWKILLLDEVEEDCLLIQQMLMELGGPKSQLIWAQSLDDRLKILASGSYHAALIDAGLIVQAGSDLIRQAVEIVYPAPVILLTGSESRMIDLEALQAGATQCLPKAELNPELLERFIRYSIERKQAEAALHASYKELQKQAEELQQANARLSIKLNESQRDETILHSIPGAGKQVKGAAEIANRSALQEQAEVELQAAHRRTVEILESISDAFYSLDQESRFTYVNQRAASLWGKQPGDLLGKNIWEVFPSGKATESYQKMQEALINRQPIQYESYSSFLDQWVDVHLYPTEQGLSVYFRDITERKRSEQALRDRNEGLALLSEAAADLLRGRDPKVLLDRIYTRLSGPLGLEAYAQYTLSPDGCHLELGAMAGYPTESIQVLQRLKLGQGVCGSVALTRQPVIAEDLQRSTDPRITHLRSLGITAYACFPLIVQERLIGTLSFGTRQYNHFDSESTALLNTVSDLIATAMDRWRAGLELQNYAGQLEQRNRDLQEFAFVASHDLQEPLRKIESFSDTLLQQPENLGEKQHDYLSRIQKSASRMRAMIDGLLQLSHLDSYAQPYEHVDLTQVVRGILFDLEGQIQRSGARVEVSALPSIEADPLQMRQLFQNLVSNALKYQPAGNTPHVKIYAQQPEPGWIQISVQDNGIGFPSEAAERIFQPFQRAVGRTQYEGSGMGLAICRKITERHGGSISAQSLERQGATFVVTLPLKR